MALLLYGESRWKIFKHYLFWVKISEILLPLLIFPFCVTYDDHAFLHTKDKLNWFNISVKYPFKYYENTTAVYTGEDSPPKFGFDGAISVCVQLFVVVVIVTMVQAIFMVVLSCITHKTRSIGQIIMYSELFSDIIVAFLLVVSTSLWLYNIFTLRKEIEVEIKSFEEYAKSSCTASELILCQAVASYPDYTLLFLSVAFGFLDFLVWLANIVFVYRDILQPVQEDANGNNALVWAQELPEASASVQ